MTVSIRPVEARDEAAWRALWDGYCTFYQATIPPDVTDATWARLLDPDAPVFGLVACDAEDRPVGLANCVLHLNTWTKRPVCYLEDLFVAPAARRTGAGRAFIAALTEQGRREGWHRLYWMTKADNREARALYDKVGQLTDWVRYDAPL
jgi:GNAT superfamily N-acetyltransferase